MPLFRKKPKSPPTKSAAFRSVEHLPQLTDRRGSSVSTAIPAAVAAHPHPHPHPLSHPQPQPQPQPLPVPAPPPYHHPAHSPSQSSLHRSQSQRHSRSDPAVGIPASPSAPQQRFEVDPSDDDHDEPEHHSRRTIRNIFSLHSNTPRDSTGPLERHRSLRRSSPAAARRNRPLSVDTTSPDNRPPLTSRSREYVVESLRTTPQSPMPPQEFIPSSQNNSRLPRSPHIPSIQRSNTDSSLVVEPLPPPTTIHQPSPIDPSRKPPPPELIPGPPQHQQPQPSLDPSSARPSSRQSLGPPSPLRPLPSHPTDAPQQGMSERPSTGPAPGAPASSAFGQGSSDTGLRNNTAAHGSSEPGRSTPTSNHSRSRDEADLDVRTLVQKHDELQAKYSKVKRYYFEKEAQVQHLQNTVAHQRMAVSRTVLDDNEYANRFGRLDGAIKDLAFAVRKDWKSLPGWLSGFVNEDAAAVGTKEMTAIGRAFMSRWLADEVFGRYFHPVLEPSFSRQLKEIELNLRRQQGKTATEEDKENAIARISNWRRTTLDGLEDALIGPTADEHRAQLIDHLVKGLFKALTDHLQSPPPPGIENGARMIVENAIGIAEKIPLESRDLCVDYLLPGTVLHEPTMKVETGIPPLTNAAPPESTATRGSDDQDRPADHPGAEDLDADRDSSSGSTNPEGATPGREQRVRSVFSSLMGRKPQQQQQQQQGGGGPPIAPGPGGNGDSAVRPTTAGADDRAGGGVVPQVPQPRIRFSTFVTADVRGRGPVNVLVKAPVYLME